MSEKTPKDQPEPNSSEEPQNETPASPGSESSEPTQEQLVEQLHESDQSDSGPNETLRGHIETYSRYAPVFASLGHTLVGAVFAPLLLLFLFVQLSPVYDLNELRGAVQRGLGSIILPLFVASFLTRSLTKNGLATRQLGWAASLCHGLKPALDAIVFGFLPLRFLFVAVETFENGKWNDSLGRLTFMLSMLAITVGMVFCYRNLRIWLAEVRGPRSWYGSFRNLLLLFLPLMPLSLLLMAALGYYFTAEELSSRMLWTILSMVGIAMLGGFSSRLLLNAQFGIKLRELSRDEDGQIANDESIDISAISQQVNRLIRATAFVAMVLVGWQIWENVLPAINYLDQVQLWQSLNPSADGTGVTTWITLRHLIITCGVLMITYILSSNLPGLLEITLLERLPLDRGGRYAISFIMRYLVAVAGILIACQMLGFSWNRVQWLAAGLTVGLGFGLQEIFANLISGIIILIERPVRIGDVITVNGTTGTVTKMALRATTIMDLDYRELIVPNKKFITEDVMNWTLSDNKCRLIIKVGVAYGSDTTLVQNTLQKVAKRYPLITDDPKPTIVFSGFGDSTLNFELRVVVPNRKLYFQVMHELHMAVEEAFRQKDIEIAFPQQDIYIKNLADLPVPSPTGSETDDGSMPGSLPGSASQGAKGTIPGPRASADDVDTSAA